MRLRTDIFQGDLAKAVKRNQCLVTGSGRTALLAFSTKKHIADMPAENDHAPSHSVLWVPSTSANWSQMLAKTVTRSGSEESRNRIDLGQLV